MAWSLKKKMLGMGMGSLLALAMLAGMNYLSYPGRDEILKDPGLGFSASTDTKLALSA